MKLYFLLLAVLVSFGVSTRSFAKPAKVDADAFRRIFFGILGDSVPQASKNLLLYYPGTNETDLRELPNATTPESFLGALTDKYRHIVPSALYLKGTQVPTVSEKGLENLLLEEPITIVVVPGIFGEFIDNRAFEEVFANTQSYGARTWKQALKQNAGSPLVTDAHFSLQALANKHVEIEKLVQVSSIDNAQGRPLVQVVLFATPKMSLETLGNTDEKAKLFLRRFDKFYALLGQHAPNHITFMGYSQGGITGMNLLAQAKRESEQDTSLHPWLSRVRAMVSLGGVTFGSDLADDAFENPNSETHIQLQLLHTLSSKLQPLQLLQSIHWMDSAQEKLRKIRGNARRLKENTQTIKNNLLAWRDLGIGLYQHSDPNYFMNLIKTAFKVNPTSDRIVQMKELITVLQKEFGMLSEDFGLTPATFFTEYNLNVRRFQRMVEEIEQGVQGLSTAARMEWWKNPAHELPTQGIRYYSLPAVMMNPEFEKNVSTGITQNPLGYDVGSVDYEVLKKSTEDFRKVSGLSLNDSQVAIHKVHLWPQLAAMLNPVYSREGFEIDSTMLGVIGTHHWGIALRVANDFNGYKNPYPRTKLLQAIAAAVATDVRAAQE